MSPWRDQARHKRPAEVRQAPRAPACSVLLAAVLGHSAVRRRHLAVFLRNSLVLPYQPLTMSDKGCAMSFGRTTRPVRLGHRLVPDRLVAGRRRLGLIPLGDGPGIPT